MLTHDKPEYVALVSAIAVANGVDEAVAANYLEDAIAEVEDGNASYASAATSLRLRVNKPGECGFDAADYLAAIV